MCICSLQQPDPEGLRKEIAKTRTLTNKPFGVNVSFLPASAPPDYAAYIKVIIEEGIKVVETAGNNPGKWIKMLKDGGVMVIHKCVTVRHAENAIKLGADIISMDGYECAGHPGMEDIGSDLMSTSCLHCLYDPIYFRCFILQYYFSCWWYYTQVGLSYWPWLLVS